MFGPVLGPGQYQIRVVENTVTTVALGMEGGVFDHVTMTEHAVWNMKGSP